MFNDFFYSAYFAPFPSQIPIVQSYPFIQPYFKLSIHSNKPFQPLTQSYPTKQIAVKQQDQTIKKQEDSIMAEKNQPNNAEVKKKKQNKSIFHNYQKHLVTTLKQKITIEQIKEFDPQDLCLKELWHGFNKAKIANRTLLLAVFGQERPNNSQLLKYLEKCQLEGITKKFSVPQIKDAQRKIRKIVKEYFKDKNLDSELAGRKLPKEQKTIFKHYVSYFLAQLAQGTLNRRLPKRYKRQMML